MSHKPIFLSNVSFLLTHKVCFENFSATIAAGSRIGIVGANGCGKSTLLRIIQGFIEPTSGNVSGYKEVAFGFVPQLPDDHEDLSGGQRFNAALSQAIALQPDILCLDEPTNHLDHNNRRSLMCMLQHFEGSVIVVSHDVDLLRLCVDTIWCIEDGSITVYAGSYDVFVATREAAQIQLREKIKSLGAQQAKIKKELIRGRERSVRRARAHKGENDRNLAGFYKSSADDSLGKGQAEMGKLGDALAKERARLREPEEIRVNFELLTSDLTLGRGNVIEISDGSVAYGNKAAVVENINLSISTGERVALVGENGSGKSTIFKALLNQENLIKEGSWYEPKPEFIGYLDQHYQLLDQAKTVLETITSLKPMPHAQVRALLNDFLFRKNEEVYAHACSLSGGEKARLALACIAVLQPPVLLLDEVTNNLDLQTREHVIKVLNAYPGTLIVISHDEDFLQCIRLDARYNVNEWAIAK